MADSPNTLVFDVGGTGLKARVLDVNGTPQGAWETRETPRPASPETVIEALEGLATKLPAAQRVSLGFPGVVVGGKVFNAPNLGTEMWAGIDLEKRLRQRFEMPCRVLNDADLQGFGVIDARGVELVMTLGTGVGSALYRDGQLIPNLEIGHHPFEGNSSYEDRLGARALATVEHDQWRARVLRMCELLLQLFNPRRLFLGGGNARLLDGDGLPESVALFSTEEALRGGLALWTES